MIDRSYSCRLAALVILVGGAFPVLAEASESCAYQPALSDAATLLLVEPLEKPNFWRDHHGDDAAYLTIRHGGLDEAGAGDLISGLEARSHPPQRIRELALARAGTEGRLARIAELAPQARQASILPELGRSVLLALVEHDGGDWLVGEMARWRDVDAVSFGASHMVRDVALTVADLDDDRKAELIEKAEQAGLWRLAMAVSAMRDDFTGLLDLLERLPREHWAPGFDEAENRRYWISASLGLAGLDPRFDPAAQPFEVRQIDAERLGAHAMRAIVRLAAFHPDAGLLMTAFNQTGEDAIGAVVAETVLGMVERGELDPVADPDAVVVQMVTGLDVTLGRARRENTLKGFNLVSPTGREGGRADAHFDRILARAALSPWLRGEVPQAPGRPPALTAGYDWDRAAAVAATLVQGGTPDEEDRLLAADLFTGAGRFDEALAMLAGTEDWRNAMPRVHEIMLDLDRRCGHALAPILPMMEPIYRFEAR